jgi:hypothetical protein
MQRSLVNDCNTGSPRVKRILISALLALSPLMAQAQAPTDALSQCLADSTSGKDRKDLARWVFFAMASHPEIKQFTSPSLAAASEDTHKVMAATFTRLLTDACLTQTQAAFKAGGSKAIEVAFQTLGALAMQELMSNPEVSTNMGKFEKLIDQGKLSKAFSTD